MPQSRRPDADSDDPVDPPEGDDPASDAPTPRPVSTRRKKVDVFYDDELTGRALDSRLLVRLLSYLGAHKGLLLLSVVTTLAMAAVSITWPKLLGDFIDGPFTQLLEAIRGGSGDGIPSAVLGEFNHYIMLFVLFVVAQFVTAGGHMWVTAALGQYTILDLRVQVFAHLQRLDMQYFERNPVGRLVTRVTSDIESLSEMFSSGVVALGSDILRIVGILVVMLILDPTLTGVVVVVTPFLALVSWIFGNRMRRAFRETRKRIAAVNAYLQESVTGLSLIQAFRQEDKAERALEDRNQAHYRAVLSTIFNFALFAPIVGLFTHIATALLLYVGGTFLVESMVGPASATGGDVFTFGAFTAFYFWTKKLFEPIRELSERYNILQSAMASSERIFRILDTDATIVDAAETKPLPESGIKGHIRFNNVSFAYIGEQWVLRDVNFDAPPGSKIALVGATGSGKTTVTNLIPRFLRCATRRGRDRRRRCEGTTRSTSCAARSASFCKMSSSSAVRSSRTSGCIHRSRASASNRSRESSARTSSSRSCPTATIRM
jgi:ATP-binding cassette subfamily B multidrug efflux pump